MKKILASLLAAVTIALTLTATATAPSGDAGGGDGDRVLPPGSSVARDRRCHHCLPTARLCGVPRLRTTRLRTRVLLGIPARLRRCRPRRRVYRSTGSALAMLRLGRPAMSDLPRRLHSRPNDRRSASGLRGCRSRSRICRNLKVNFQVFPSVYDQE